jgi:amidophosphoribosyltransferase
MRIACPPLLYSCEFLNFSRLENVAELATHKAIKELEGVNNADVTAYQNPESPEYAAMVDEIRQKLNLTTLKFQRLDDLVEAIGLPKEKLCTHCWDNSSYS